MILWFTIAQVIVAVAAGLFCVIAGLAGRRPSDWTVGSLALVELLLLRPGRHRDRRAVRGQPAVREPAGILGLPRVRRAAARRRRRVGAARAQPLEHRDHGHRRALHRGDGVAHAGDLDRPGRLTRRRARRSASGKN